MKKEFKELQLSVILVNSEDVIITSPTRSFGSGYENEKEISWIH